MSALSLLRTRMLFWNGNTTLGWGSEYLRPRESKPSAACNGKGDFFVIYKYKRVFKIPNLNLYFIPMKAVTQSINLQQNHMRTKWRLLNQLRSFNQKRIKNQTGKSYFDTRSGQRKNEKVTRNSQGEINLHNK